jgi:hypothetical protein
MNYLKIGEMERWRDREAERWRWEGDILLNSTNKLLEVYHQLVILEHAQDAHISIFAPLEYMPSHHKAQVKLYTCNNNTHHTTYVIPHKSAQAS